MLPWSKEVELAQAGRRTRPASPSSTSAAKSPARSPSPARRCSSANRGRPDHLQPRSVRPRRTWLGARARQASRASPGARHHDQPAHACPVGAEDVDERGEHATAQGTTPRGRSWCRGRTPRPPCPAAVIRSSCVRADDCVGPMNRHSNSPQTQNAMAPDSVSKVEPTAIIAASEPMMTGLEPTRSSSSPPSTAPTAATTQARHPEQQDVGLRDAVDGRRRAPPRR